MKLVTDFGGEARDRFLQCADVRTVIDIGCGDGAHAQALRAAGMDVATVSLVPPADHVADYLDTDLGPVDGIWASHVLEHMLNVGFFLCKCFDDLRDGGVLAVTVPPAKAELVGGHLSLWTEALLLYRLVLAGFDCRQARVGVYGYNISVIVRKTPLCLPPLKMDSGDLEHLAKFFPCEISQGCNGQFGNINW